MAKQTKTEETVDAVKEETKTTKSTKKVETKKDSSNTELETLKAQNELLMKQIAEIQKQIAKGNVGTTPSEKTLTNDTDITVISLTQGILNLCTEGMGQGIVYTFNDLYEEMDIPFDELRNIVRTNRQMAENGRFFIQNEEAVKKLRLSHKYESLLTPEDIRNLLNETPSAVVDYYKMANNAQQDLIKDLLIEANFDGNADKNIVYAFTEATGIDFSNFINTKTK